MKFGEVLQNRRLNEWGQMVQACKSSGKSISAWCSENDINEKTYYYRQHKVCAALPANLETRPATKEIAFAEVPKDWNRAATKDTITVRMRGVDAGNEMTGSKRSSSTGELIIESHKTTSYT